MAKDTVSLLRRFIADEDASLREGRAGLVWAKEKGRIGPVIRRAWKELSWKECRSLYTHLMRITRKVPNVADIDYTNLLVAYQNMRPGWDRMGFVFRIGLDEDGPLPSGFAEDRNQFKARHAVAEGFTGYPTTDAMRGRAGRFQKASGQYGAIALEAIRRCGYSESRDSEEVPGSQTYWGLVLLALLHPTAGLDYLDEAGALPHLRGSRDHGSELRAFAQAAQEASPTEALGLRLEQWETQDTNPSHPGAPENA